MRCDKFRFSLDFGSVPSVWKHLSHVCTASWYGCHTVFRTFFCITAWCLFGSSSWLLPTAVSFAGSCAVTSCAASSLRRAVRPCVDLICCAASVLRIRPSGALRCLQNPPRTDAQNLRAIIRLLRFLFLDSESAVRSRKMLFFFFSHFLFDKIPFSVRAPVFLILLRRSEARSAWAGCNRAASCRASR